MSRRRGSTHSMEEPLPTMEEPLPTMTFEDVARGLERVASAGNRPMIPYLVSALHQQAPFLSGQMILFEILRSANCVADEPARVFAAQP